MKRQIADRLFISGLSFTFVALATLEPQSLGYRLAQLGGACAQVIYALLAVVAFATVMDTLINDMMPERFVWKTPLGRRRGLWMTLAFIYAILAFVVLQSYVGGLFSAVYMLCSLRCAAVAFLDLYYQYRKVAEVASPIAEAVSDE